MRLTVRKFRERQSSHSNAQTSLSYTDVTDRYDKLEIGIEKELEIDTNVQITIVTTNKKGS